MFRLNVFDEFASPREILVLPKVRNHFTKFYCIHALSQLHINDNTLTRIVEKSPMLPKCNCKEVTVPKCQMKLPLHTCVRYKIYGFYSNTIVIVVLAYYKSSNCLLSAKHFSSQTHSENSIQRLTHR